MTINIPATGKPAKLGYSPDEIRAQVAKLHTRYGAFVDQACTLNNVPTYLLEAIVLTENFDLKPDSVNRKPGRPVHKEATGLGQHMMFSATDIISRTITKKLMNPAKRAVLVKQLGETRMAFIEKNKGTTQYVVTQRDLIDPEFNLMLTGLFLSQLIAEENESGTLRLDKVMLRYNQGYYFKMPRLNQTTDLLLAGVGGEGHSYILKNCGKGGFLDLLTS